MSGRLTQSITPESIRRAADRMDREPETAARCRAIRDLRALADWLEAR